MIYILLLLLSFLLTYFIKNYALKKSLVAHVNERSSHSIPTPHGGGIAIALTWFAGLIYLFVFDKIEPTLFYALLVGALINIVSFFDDIYELSARLRLAAQSAVTVVGLYFIGGLESIDFGVFAIQNQIVTSFFAFLMILWYINLTNFIDGINGYVGSEVVFLSVTGVLLFGDAHFCVLAVAVLGFLYWNYNKAKIFMGDVGSTLLGYNIGIFTIYYANQEASSFWVWIMLFAVFWFDATVTLVRRKLNSEKLSQAHKKHAYQRLTQAGWSHFKVTNYVMALNVVIFSFVYFIPNLAVSFGLIIVLLCVVMIFVEKKNAFR